MVRAIDQYRNDFRPGQWTSPYVIVSTSAVIADTAEQAHRLLLPEAWSAAYSRTQGEFPALLPPSEIDRITMTDRQRRIFDESLLGHVHGTETTVTAALDNLIARTGADEILVHTSTYDRSARLDSHRRLAAAVGLSDLVTAV